MAVLDAHRAALTTLPISELERGQQWLSSVRTDGHDVTSFGDQSISYMGITHGIDDGSAASLSHLVTEALRQLRANAATVARLKAHFPATAQPTAAKMIVTAVESALEEAPSGFALYEKLVVPCALSVNTLLHLWQDLETLMNRIEKQEGHKVRALQRYILADAQLITEQKNLLAAEESAAYPPHVHVQRQSLARGYTAPLIDRLTNGAVSTTEAYWLRAFLRQLIAHESRMSQPELPLSHYRRLVTDLTKVLEE